MASVPIHYIDLRTFSYATEDEARVETAIRTFLPEDFELERAVNKGHHGDRIVVLSARVEQADDIRLVLDKVKQLKAIEQVVAELQERVDEDCSLFLHLDKQAALRGEVKLGKGILLRAKMEAYPAKKSIAVDAAREALT